MLRPTLVAAVLLAVATPSAGVTCNVNNVNSFATCARNILEVSRPALKARFDPLLLGNMNGTGAVDWWIKDVRVHSLSKYRIEALNIVLRGPLRLMVQFAVKWPTLLGTAAGQFHFCGILLGNKRCLSFTAGLRIEAIKPSGNLKTELLLSYRNERLHLAPTATILDIKVPNINVVVSLDSFLGMLDRILGYPSQKYANQLTTDWWAKNKQNVKDMAKSQLHKLIHKYLSPELEVLLQGVVPNPTKPNRPSASYAMGVTAVEVAETCSLQC